MSHNRFLSKQVRSRVMRADRAERHADRMALEQMRSSSPVVVRSAEPLVRESSDDELLSTAAELGIDLSGVLRGES